MRVVRAATDFMYARNSVGVMTNFAAERNLWCQVSSMACSVRVAGTTGFSNGVSGVAVFFAPSGGIRASRAALRAANACVQNWFSNDTTGSTVLTSRAWLGKEGCRIWVPARAVRRRGCGFPSRQPALRRRHGREVGPRWWRPPGKVNRSRRRVGNWPCGDGCARPRGVSTTG